MAQIINKLLMMRGRGIGGPNFQRINTRLNAKSVGNFYGANGPGYGGLFTLVFRTTTNDESITVPTRSGYPYDMFIDWGDGSEPSHVTVALSPEATHVYAEPGDYEVTIEGQCSTIYFNGTGDNLKIINIKHWGDFTPTSMLSAFTGCSNMTVTATDPLDLSNCPDLQWMFQDCLVANPRTDNWITTGVTNIQGMFDGASLANPKLSNWDVSTLQDASRFIANTSFTTENYDEMLRGWALQSPLQVGVTLDVLTVEYTDILAHEVLTDPPNLWNITDGGTGVPVNVVTFQTFPVTYLGEYVTYG